MLTMDQIHHIRQLYYEQDKNISEIAQKMHMNWRTVQKFIDMDAVYGARRSSFRFGTVDFRSETAVQFD